MDRVWVPWLGVLAVATAGCSATHDIDGLSKGYTSGAGGHGGVASGSSSSHGSTTGHGGAGGGGGPGGATASGGQGGTAGASTTSMGGTTSTGPTCGENGLPCCGGTCNSATLACDPSNQTCAPCGGPGNLCCPAAPTCGGGLTCDPGSGRCAACSDLNQLCCDNRYCAASTGVPSVCDPTNHCVPCGDVGMPCCDGSSWTTQCPVHLNYLECRDDGSGSLKCLACCVACKNAPPGTDPHASNLDNGASGHETCLQAGKKYCDNVNNCPGSGNTCCAAGNNCFYDTAPPYRCSDPRSGL